MREREKEREIEGVEALSHRDPSRRSCMDSADPRARGSQRVSASEQPREAFERITKEMGARGG